LETCDASKQQKASSTIRSVVRRQTQTHTAGQAQQSCATCSACVQKWRCVRAARANSNVVTVLCAAGRTAAGTACSRLLCCDAAMPPCRCCTGRHPAQSCCCVVCSAMPATCTRHRCFATAALQACTSRLSLEYPAVMSSAVLLLPLCRRCSSCVHLISAGAALAATLLTPAAGLCFLAMPATCARHCAVMPTGHSASTVLAAHLISAGRQAACSGDSRCTTTNTSTNSNTSARQATAAAAVVAAEQQRQRAGV
jgi:hypothetical protein